MHSRIGLLSISVLVGIAGPAPAQDVEANERQAVANLRAIAEAQRRFKVQGEVDQNGDGNFEYGWLAELAGVVPLRTSPPRFLDPPLLPEEFGLVDENGFVLLSGYLYMMYLADVHGAPLREAPGGGSPGTEGPSCGAFFWVCYAIPERYGVTGRWALVVNEHGSVVKTRNVNNNKCERYAGNRCYPEGDAAYSIHDAGTIKGIISFLYHFPGPAVDGNGWQHACDEPGLSLHLSRTGSTRGQRYCSRFVEMPPSRSSPSWCSATWWTSPARSRSRSHQARSTMRVARLLITTSLQDWRGSS